MLDVYLDRITKALVPAVKTRTTVDISYVMAEWILDAIEELRQYQQAAQS